MKNAYIRYYLAMLYLMNLDVAKYAFDATLSLDARVLCAMGMGIGVVNLWLALRLDAVSKEVPALPGQVVKANLGFSALWNVALAVSGNGHPFKFALAVLFGGIALAMLDGMRDGAGGRRPQLLVAR